MIHVLCLEAEVQRLSISESYQKSGLKESEHLTHSGEIQVTNLS